MQALLETGAGLERRLTIRLPMPPVEQEYAARIRSWELRTKKSSHQDDHRNLRNRIALGVKHSSFLEALSQHKLSAIGTPSFGAAAEENGSLVFSIDFAVRPQIDIESYGDIQINRPTAEVTEQDIDAAIQAQYNSARCHDTQLRTEIRGKLEHQLAEATRQAIKPQLIEALLAKHTFSPPEVMVAREFEKRMARWRQRQASNPNLQIPDEAQVRLNSSRAISLGIIFNEIISSAKIIPEETHIRRAIKHVADASNDPEKVISRYHNNEVLLSQIEGVVRIDLAIDWLVSRATVMDIPSSFTQIAGHIN